MDTSWTFRLFSRSSDCCLPYFIEGILITKVFKQFANMQEIYSNDHLDFLHLISLSCCRIRDLDYLCKGCDTGIQNWANPRERAREKRCARMRYTITPWLNICVLLIRTVARPVLVLPTRYVRLTFSGTASTVLVSFLCLRFSSLILYLLK